MLLTALTVLGGSSLTTAGDPGEAGALFLRFGIGAREAAMGGTGVASSTSAAAAYWNPARLVFEPVTTGLVLQHHRYLNLFNHESAALVHRTGAGQIGLTFSGLYSDSIERYSSETVGVPEGTFKPYSVSVGLNYAFNLGPDFAIGAAAKMVYERIDLYSDTGYAFDLFIAHRAAAIEGLFFGASATNLGGQMNLNDGPYDLPRSYRIGAAYTPPRLLGGMFTLAGDVVFPNDSNEKAHLGAEVRIVPELALRVGTRVNYDSQGLTAGAGFMTSVVGVSYAYEEQTTDGFDDGHKFSLELNY